MYKSQHELGSANSNQNNIIVHVSQSLLSSRAHIRQLKAIIVNTLCGKFALCSLDESKIILAISLL